MKDVLEAVSQVTTVAVSVVGLLAAVVALLKGANELRSPGAAAPEDRATSGTRRKAAISARRRAGPWLGIGVTVGLVSALVLGYWFSQRPSYRLETIVMTGEDPPVFKTKHRIEKDSDEHLVDAEDGAGPSIAAWLSDKFAAGRPSVPYTLEIPADLREGLVLTGLETVSPAFSYETEQGTRVRIETPGDPMLGSLDGGFYFVIDVFGYEPEKIWISPDRDEDTMLIGNLTPRHPGSIRIAVADFAGDENYRLSTDLSAYLATNSDYIVISKADWDKKVASLANDTTGDPVNELNQSRILQQDLFIEGTFTKYRATEVGDQFLSVRTVHELVWSGTKL